MSAIENLEAHLAGFQTNIKALISYISEKLLLQDSDIVFASGSVIDGVGNRHSDIDLFLITSRDDIEYSSLTDILMKFSGCDIDLRVLKSDYVATLIERFLEWAKIKNKQREAFLFNNDERAFLHRLVNSVSLFNHESLKKLQNLIPKSLLLKHKLDYSAHLSRTIQLDLEGLRIAGDYHSLVVSALELLGYSLDAFLATTGNSCPNRKWRTRHIANLSRQETESLSPFLFKNSLLETFLEFYRFPMRNNPLDYMEHALNITDFARAILAISEYKILSQDAETVSFPPYLNDHLHCKNDLSSRLSFDTGIFYQEENGFLIGKLADKKKAIVIAQEVFKIFSCLSQYSELLEREYVFEKEELHNIEEAFYLFKAMNFEAKPIYIKSDMINNILEQAIAC